MPESILVVAAHPDDEVLGCGGAIARHCSVGDAVHIAIMGEGATSRDRQRVPAARTAELNRLRAAAQQAGRTLGAASVDTFDLPDNRFDSIDLLDIVKLVEELVVRHQPSVVYTHHAGDLNVDHVLVHRAVITACRPVPRHCVKRILAFEVPSSTEWTPPGSLPAFAPNWFCDISSVLDVKLRALDAYADEMRPWPHPRSKQAVEHLARWRGTSVGTDAAEAFMLLRCLEG